MLYTPFLPEAAAGTLEPRHVVTPLREILERTYLRLGAIDAHDPARKTVQLRTHDGETEELPYDQLLLALGSVSRVLPVPGLTEHAVGFKSLADAIWLRNHVVETLEAANATEDPARHEELLTYVFVGGGYAGLEALAELQDFAADAMEAYPRARLHGMRWVLVEATDRVLPEIDPELADYALRELRGRGIDIRLGTTLEEVEADSATPLHRRDAAHPDRRLDRRRRPRTRACAISAVPLDDRGRVPVDEHLRVAGHGLASGRSATAPRCPTPGGGLCAADRPARVRQGPVAARNIAAALGVGSAAALPLPDQGLLRQPRPLQGGRPDRRPHLPRLPGLVDGPHLPHEPDPGRRPQGPRRRSTGPSACRSAATSPRSARSATPEPLRAGRLRGTAGATGRSTAPQSRPRRPTVSVACMPRALVVGQVAAEASGPGGEAEALASRCSEGCPRSASSGGSARPVGRG